MSKIIYRERLGNVIVLAVVMLWVVVAVVVAILFKLPLDNVTYIAVMVFVGLPIIIVLYALRASITYGAGGIKLVKVLPKRSSEVILIKDIRAMSVTEKIHGKNAPKPAVTFTVWGEEKGIHIVMKQGKDYIVASQNPQKTLDNIRIYYGHLYP